MNKSASIIGYIYNSMKDPLFYATGIPYIKEVNKRTGNKYSFYIITYEQEKYALSDSEKETLKNELKKDNIYWYPLKWHAGTNLFIKAYDLIAGFFLFTYLLITTGTKLVFALGNVAGAFSFLYAKLFRIKHFVYTFEPHSEFMADFGLWDKKGKAYKLLNKFEYWMGMYSDYIGTGTQNMVHRLKEMNSAARVYRIPSCIDERNYAYSEIGREKIREQFNIGDRKTILYLGKFGGVYYEKEIIAFFQTLYKHNRDIFYLVVTPDEPQKIKKWFAEYGIPTINFAVTFSPFSEVGNYISAGDIGLIAVPPYPSQKFRSPIKAGEYLCCGLPYIVCNGVSEDDVYAEKYKVGIVLDDFSEASINRKTIEIKGYLNFDRKSNLERMRKIAIEYRGLEIAVSAFKQIFEHVYPQNNNFVEES
jgi:hypothetical protein